MISNEKKFIFIHLPKTGGTSIKYALSEYSDIECVYEPQNFYLKYPSFDEVEQKGRIPLEYGINFKDEKMYKHCSIKYLFKSGYIDEEKYNEYCIFTISRNPWDRLLSNFFHRTKQLKTFSYTNFSKFLSLDDIQKLHHWETLIHPKGDIRIDNVLRFNHLQEDFNILCDQLNIPRRKLLHFLKTEVKNKPYTEYYDKYPELIERVRKISEIDIKIFNYKYGED